MKKPKKPAEKPMTRGEKNRATRAERAHMEAVANARSEVYASGIAANAFQHERSVYESSVAELQRRLSLALATPPLPAIDHGLNKVLSPIIAYHLSRLGLIQNARGNATATIVAHNGEVMDVLVLPLDALMSIVGEMKRFGYG